MFGRSGKSASCSTKEEEKGHVRERKVATVVNITLK